MRVHFYQAKEQLMTAFRKNRQPPERFSHIQLYADLSQYTMQKRKSMLSVTKVLRNHSIPYYWGYPTKLSVTLEGKTTVITCMEEGVTFLHSIDIIPEHDAENPSPSVKLSKHG